MKKTTLILVGLISCFFTSCNSDDNAAKVEAESPQTLVKKMSIKVYSGGNEPFTGTFDFTYNENKQVTSIEKKVIQFSGQITESQNYTYNYSENKVISYAVLDEVRNVSYLNNNILNLGLGSDLVYDQNGNIIKDLWEKELVYQNNNQTGTVSEPNMYTYDNGNNPFLNNNIYFKTVFGEQLKLYNSAFILRTPNNIINEDHLIDIVHEIHYGANHFPEKIVTLQAGSFNILEELSFEYVDL